MEGMLDNLSQPVAFATAPLHQSASSIDTDQEDNNSKTRRGFRKRNGKARVGEQDGSGDAEGWATAREDADLDEFDSESFADEGRSFAI